MDHLSHWTDDPGTCGLNEISAYVIGGWLESSPRWRSPAHQADTAGDELLRAQPEPLIVDEVQYAPGYSDTSSCSLTQTGTGWAAS